MSKPRKHRRPTLMRRLVYLVMLLSGGGAGVGGWVFKDHPAVQALYNLVTGNSPADGPDQDLDRSMTDAVVDLLKPTGRFQQSGAYQVTIRQVHLDPNLFAAGHTVDIQAKVLKRDAQGQVTTLWETGPFGERLAVAGKDELVAEWDHRPFVVQWRPGDQLTIEVYDGRPGLFAQPKRFFLAPAEADPREFPLKPGTFPLQSDSRKPDANIDPRNLKIVLQSQRVGDLPTDRQTRSSSSSPSPSRSRSRTSSEPQSQSQAQAQAQPDDRPIVIK